MATLRKSNTVGADDAGDDKNPFNEEDLLSSRKALIAVNLRHGKLIDGIQLEAKAADGSPTNGDWFGNSTGGGGDEFKIDVDGGDYLTELTGYAGHVVDTIKFNTAKGNQSQRYGGDGGAGDSSNYTLKANPGEEIIGIFGIAGKDNDEDDRVVIKQLGVWFRTRN